jgi:uncharacterized protein with GYD domain
MMPGHRRLDLVKRAARARGTRANSDALQRSALSAAFAARFVEMVVSACAPEEENMATYVILANWTEKGVATAKDTVNRADSVKQLVASMGGEMTQIYWTLGRYDIVAIVTAPDEETAAAIGAAVSGLGSVRTESLRAFTASEMTGILSKIR